MDCEDDCKDVEVQYRRKQLRHEDDELTRGVSNSDAADGW